MPQPLSSNGPQTTSSTVDDNQVQANAQPTAQPGTQTQPDQPAQPNQPAQPPAAPPATQKRGLFDRVLHAMSGSPTVVDPKTGETKEVPMTRSTMSSHILAGALTSIINGAIQGGAASANAPAGPTGTNTPGNMAAMGAGAKVGQDTFNKMKNGPQAEMDKQALGKFNAAKNNVDLMQQMVTSSRLNHEYLSGMVDNNQHVVQSLKDSDAQSSDPNPANKAVVASGLTWEQAQKQFHPINQNMVVDGMTEYVAEDGSIHEQPTYTIVNPDATVQLNRDAIDTLAKYGIQGFQDLQTKTKGNIPLRAANVVKFAQQANALSQTEGWLKDAATQIGVDPVDLVAAVKKDHTLLPAINDAEQALSQGWSTAGTLDKLRQTTAGGKLIGLLGRDKVDQFIQDKQNESVESQSEARAAGQVKVQETKNKAKLLGPLTDNMAASILSDPNATADNKSRAAAFQTIKNTQKELQATTARAIKTGDPNQSAQLMADGVLTLSELKARSSDAKFITDVTTAAQKIARDRGESTWTPQVGEAQFKNAQSNQNVQFFGNVNSLLDPNGTLQQLSEQHEKLNNGSIPLFNKWGDYLAYQAGDDALAGFMQTAIGVADDYAKVMGGGAGTDASRLQVMRSFANAHNPAQMQAAIDAARKAVKSQAVARIGRNRVMQQMFGQNVPENVNNQQLAKAPPSPQQRPVPPGKVAARDAKGNVVGYADDNRGTNYTAFH